MIVTSGYELVPVLRSNPNPNDTVPTWWHSPRLAPLLRHRQPPSCEPKDLGRGDIIRLTPSLFQYKVISTWQNASSQDARDEKRVEYKGASFKSCRIYKTRFDHNNLNDITQTITTGIYCPDSPNAFLETSATFTNSPIQDFVAQYYGGDRTPFYFVEKSPRTYRGAVFAVLDLISTDSLATVADPAYLPSPAVTLSAEVNVTTREILSTHITYFNGTDDYVLESESIFADSILNLAVAVAHAINFDLRNTEPNIFLDPSVVNNTITPNQTPQGVDRENWIANRASSFYFGGITPPFESFAQMLRAGLPTNVTLGDLSDTPDDSQMVTNYFCPSYQLKPMSSFLSSIFVGTATMFLSVWAAWVFGTAIVARWLSDPCSECAFDSKECKKHPRQKDSAVESGNAENVVVLPSMAHDRRESDYSNLNKSG
ncbi:hypothetical protein FRC07_007611 [Ceratobasidium sp. 392]|nr:hypothetical protein FRC07_007611 [Ceratobasidium sp. 392]